MLMPFTWPVWALLIVILMASEVGKRIFPGLFQNDPILLVVCGFERHNLHAAGRWETVILHSLIILMFFMSNAFETKIVSLMVSKPSIQTIKTLEDLVNSDLKIYDNLEKNPDLLKHPVVGNLLAHAEAPNVYDKLPDAAILANSVWVGRLHEIAFDFERMQSFYVVLEGEYFGGSESYVLKFRSAFLDVFQRIHVVLTENGLMNLWKKRWDDRMIQKYVGRRYKARITNKVDLDIGDMQPAWVTLAVGLSASLVGFLCEHVKKRFNALWNGVLEPLNDIIKIFKFNFNKTISLLRGKARGQNSRLCFQKVKSRIYNTLQF